MVASQVCKAMNTNFPYDVEETGISFLRLLQAVGVEENLRVQHSYATQSEREL